MYTNFHKVTSINFDENQNFRVGWIFLSLPFTKQTFSKNKKFLVSHCKNLN